MTICLLLILAVSFLQVLIRKIPGISALTWAEEFCRFLWIFSVFLSLPYCLKTGSMLRVGFFGELLPDRAASALKTAADLCVFAAMLVLAVVSIGVVRLRLESGELSPAMLWPMWTVYAVMLAGYVLAAIRAFCVLLRSFRKKTGGES